MPNRRNYRERALGSLVNRLAGEVEVVVVQKLAMSFVPVPPRFYTFGEVDSDHVHEHQ